MEITKSTVRGALALVVLAIVVFSYRSHLLSERQQCGARLQHLSERLEVYAMSHKGVLPNNDTDLHLAAGNLPVSIYGKPFARASKPLKWKRGPAVPYLWDSQPHPFINGVHVLATDGKVYLIDRVGDPLK
jgi:hypothetical protein